MNTPIVDFVQGYAASGALRLHMPGHKGFPVLGPEVPLTEPSVIQWIGESLKEEIEPILGGIMR